MKIITQIILNLFIIVTIIKIKLYCFKNINDLEFVTYFYSQLINIFKYQIFQLICKNYFHFFYSLLYACLSYFLISNQMNHCILKIFKHLQYLCRNCRISIRFKFRMDNHGSQVLSCYALFYYCFE